MILTFKDAWNWYASVRALTHSMRALGDRHWDKLPWDGPLGQDDDLKEVRAEGIVVQVNIMAYDRLQRFLDKLDSSLPDEDTLPKETEQAS